MNQIIEKFADFYYEKALDMVLWSLVGIAFGLIVGYLPQLFGFSKYPHQS